MTKPSLFEFFPIRGGAAGRDSSIPVSAALFAPFWRRSRKPEA